MSASVYWNHTKNGIFFTPNVFYSADEPAADLAGVLPDVILTAFAA